MIVCSVDIGIKNPAYSVFSYKNETISLIHIEKSDWSKNWEEKAIKDLSFYKPDVILLEKQGFKSAYSKIVYFIKGFFYNSNTIVLVKNPSFKGSTYGNRKKKSVETFIKRIENYPTIYETITLLYSKLDDLADSFNLGYDYLVSLKHKK